MTESLHAGYLPLWNPYINFGIPQYADMSSGYWSPVTWLVASTIGYNAYTLTLEVLLYILIGGIGMYQLSGYWIFNKQVRICAGIAFMCCGFNVGHLQHFNWISGAAFLPWCLLTYLGLLKSFSLRNAVICVLAFYLLLSSAHPGISISAFYFFAAVGCLQLVRSSSNRTLSVALRRSARTHLVFLILLLLLSAGMITAYLDILPHFVRGEKLNLEDALGNPTTAQSWISTLLPFATVKNDAFFNTDPSMRNGYFSLTLLLFFLLGCIQVKSNWQKFFLVTGILFALLASGGIFKTAAYSVVPLIGYVRLNGEFRIISLICFIIMGAITMFNCIRNNQSFEGRIKWIYYFLEILLIAFISFGLYKTFHEKDSFLFQFSNINAQPGVSLKLKALIDAFSFYDTLWLQGILQLLFLWGIKWCLQKQNWLLLTKLTVINMCLASLMNIPFTGVGKSSVKDVQAVLKKSPQGIPIPPLHPIYENDSLSTEEKGLVGDWSFYSKQIGVLKAAPYPIVLKNMNEYFEKNEWGTALNFLNQPFLFVESGIDNKVKIDQYSPNKIVATVQCETSSEIILQQNFYPHWYYQNGIDKKPVNGAGISFMSAPAKQGINKVIFSFEPTLVKWMMLFSTICCLLAIIIVIKPLFKRSSLS